MLSRTERQTQTSYDRVAQLYGQKCAHEFDHKPFDRARLDHFADLVRDKGPVCDLGCGPGNLAHYLHQKGVTVCGIDLSPEVGVAVTGSPCSRPPAPAHPGSGPARPP